MNEHIKTYANLVRANKDLLIMFGGFILFGLVYHDLRAYVDSFQQIQVEQTEVLRAMEIRMVNIEYNTK